MMNNSGDIDARDINARDIITGIQQHITLIFQQPFDPPSDLARLRADYLAYLRDSYRHLDMKGILQVQQVTQQLSLAAVYVPLKATTRQAAPGEMLGRVAGRWHRWPDQELSAAELADVPIHSREPQFIEQALKSDPAVVVLGDPGAGKSTLLKIIALALAEQENGPLPVLLPLNAYARRLQRGTVSLCDFMGEYFAARQRKLKRVGQLFDHALRNNQALVLLDGLDEVQADRRFLVRLVQDFAAEYMPQPGEGSSGEEPPPVRGNRLIVTSRIVGYEEAPLAGQQWRLHTLTDFDRSDIEQFVAQWTLAFTLSVQGDSGPARRTAERERAELTQAIFSRSSVERLASNPLLLTILAMIKYTGVTLPEQRVKLYELYLEALIESWNLARSLDQGRVGPGMNYEETVQVLAPLALWLRQENPTAGLVSRHQLERWLTAYFAGPEWGLPPGEARRRGQGFLRGVEEYSNLLLERGEKQYGFLHLTLEEMLAAKGLAQLYFDDAERALALVRQTIGDPRWHETLQLTVGVMGVVQQLPKQAGLLLQKIVALESPDTLPGQAVTFAGDILCDVGPAGVSRPAAQHVTGELVTVMQRSDCPIKIRRDAGRHLGRLGWTPVPEADDLLLVPVGGAATGLDAFRRVETANGPCWLGKYPVTNGQFARFVKAGGYDNPAFWGNDGWRYRHGENPTVALIKKKNMRKSYEDWLANRPVEKRNLPYYWDDIKWNNPLSPVVGISWYEAEAYAIWLSGQVDLAAPAGKLKGSAGQPGRWEIRLPREAEWVAAMGGHGDYPWGNLFDSQRLNCADAWGGRDLSSYDNWKKWVDSEERREATTTAVATYPQGASGAGLWDGSGNVWEWQQDIYDPEQGTRTLRGGAWHGIQPNARVSDRHHFDPDYFDSGIGFRVVAAPIL
jgi:formylglycine-generating enzyme required for sulfatase activity/energy-coupling factor transporter ATP-binding protein EcfA2